MSAYAVEDTDLGTMLDDPAAKAVLTKYLPELVQNPSIEQARPMTLKMLQQFKPDMLSDQVLADIDTELAKLPAKK